jgi:hypothetical protein
MSLSQSKYLMKAPAAVTPLAPAETPPPKRTPHEAVVSILKLLAVEFPEVDFASRHNGIVLGKYVDSMGVRITLPVMRTGVKLLWDKLEMKAPPKETNQKAEPELKILSDGTRQLPLDECTEADIQSASKVQIKDWLARKKFAAKDAASRQVG